MIYDYKSFYKNRRQKASLTGDHRISFTALRETNSGVKFRVEGNNVN